MLAKVVVIIYFLSASLAAPCLVPDVENGFYHLHHRIISPGMPVGHGQNIQLYCLTGHQSQGPRSIHCWYGKWPQTLPKCIPSPCWLPEFRNGYYSGGYRSGLTIAHGSVIEFQCKPNYVKGVRVPPRCIEGRLMPEPPHCIEEDLIMNATNARDDYERREANPIQVDESSTVKSDTKPVNNSELQSESMHQYNTSQMQWCEPPEKLENVLRYQNLGADITAMPLISIAQFNSDQPETPSGAEASSTTAASPTKDSTEDEADDKLDKLDFAVYESTTSASANQKGNETDKEEKSKPVIHPHGTEIVFNCIPGVDNRKTTWKITCEDGGWVGRAMKCGKWLISFETSVRND